MPPLSGLWGIRVPSEGVCLSCSVGIECIPLRICERPCLAVATSNIWPPSLLFS